MIPARSLHLWQSEHRGMLLMAGAMLLLPVMDSTAKLLSSDLGPGQIAFVRSLIQALVLSIAVISTGQFSPMHTKAKAKTALAGAFVAGTVTCLYWSLAFLPLANAIAIFFVEPLLLTLLSAWVLKEKLSKERLMAVLLGLLGVLVVIRPNWDMCCFRISPIPLPGWEHLLSWQRASMYFTQRASARAPDRKLPGYKYSTWVDSPLKGIAPEA